MLKLLELFGGIGACSKALERLGIDYEIADYVEIDKYAVASYNAIHGTEFVPQDVCEWDKDIDVDLIMHGSPCQDFSVAGLNAGGDEGSGTRSSLLYETVRIVAKLKPKYVIWENVKNVLSQKHIHNFQSYLDKMEDLGYKNFYQVLNAKNYGIPQNRERVFVVSVRSDIRRSFSFPPEQELHLRLLDMLDDHVDKRFYVSERMLQGFLKHNENHEAKGTGFKWKPTDINGVANCIRAAGALAPTDNTIDVNALMLDASMFGIEGRLRKYNDVAPTITAREGRGPRMINENIRIKQLGNLLTFKNRKNPDAGRIYDVSGLSPTLNSMGGGHRQPFVIDDVNVKDLRIRKLTPKECWRLMGFDDEDFDKVAQVNSNTQLYKQAGNSIVVNVLEAILKNLLTDDVELPEGQTTIFDFI